MADDQRNRAERRRDGKGVKTTPGAKGLSAQLLADAESELDAMSDERPSSPGVVWTTLVDQWMAVEYQRESARTAYGRVIELHKLGRSADTKAFIQAYAEAKQEIEALEGQALAFLRGGDFSPDEIQSFLGDRRAVPGQGILIRPPQAFVDILTAQLECSGDCDGCECEEPSP